MWHMAYHYRYRRKWIETLFKVLAVAYNNGNISETVQDIDTVTTDR